MSLIPAVFSLLALVASVLLIVATLYTWFVRHKSKPTRESFAFLALSSCTTLSTQALTSILGKADPWQQCLIIAHYLRTKEIQVNDVLGDQLDPIVSALIVIFVLCYCFIVYRLFCTWDGPVSKETYFRRRSNEDEQLKIFMQEAYTDFNRRRNRRKPIVAYEPPRVSPTHPDLGNPRDAMPWRDLSRNLLRMRRNALEFGEWRTEHNFWLVKHKDHGYTIAIKCDIQMPSDSELYEFANYIRQISRPPEKIIIMLKTDSGLIEKQVGREIAEVISQNQLLDGLADFDEYCEKIKNRVEKEKLRDSPLTLNETYVVPRFRLDGDSAQCADKNIEDAIEDWLDDTACKQISLLGEYGQGKSTTALMFTYHLLEKGVENLSRIPILLELRGRSPGTMSSGELLGAWAHAYGLNSRHLEALHEAGRLLLIFDGFDEMALVGNQRDRLRHFKTLWEFSHPTAKIILTGRPNLFLDDNELKTALRIKEGSSGKLTCEAWYLEKFNFGEINDALRHIPPDTRNSIMRAVTDNSRLFDIASRPSLLHVISVLWNDDISSRAAELTSAEVMEKFLKSSLERQTEKAFNLRQKEIMNQKDHDGVESDGRHVNYPRNYMILNSAERYYFMLGISVHMMKKGETNQISIAELDEVTEKLAKVCPASITYSVVEDSDGKLPIPELIEQSDDLFLDKIKDDVRVCGLLVNDVTDGALRFGHKSFLEYLSADFSERRHAHTDEEDIDIIGTLMNISSFSDVLVNNVVRSYFGELLIWRRAREKILQNEMRHSASVLFKEIISPRRFKRILWSISTKIIINKFLHGNKTRRNPIFVLLEYINYPLATYLLSNFSSSKYDRSYLRRNFAAIYFFVAKNFILLYIILMFSNFLFRYYSFDAVILSIMTFCILFLLLGAIITERSGNKVYKVWVDVCKDQGCHVNHLYAALLGSLDSDAFQELNEDPIGIYIIQRVEPESYAVKSIEDLKNIATGSPSAWKRSIAALVLARGHSRFGELLFSNVLGRDLIARDPHRPINRKIIRNAGKKAQLSEENLLNKVESLNSFLGWDVRVGITGPDDNNSPHLANNQ